MNKYNFTAEESKIFRQFVAAAIPALADCDTESKFWRRFWHLAATFTGKAAHLPFNVFKALHDFYTQYKNTPSTSTGYFLQSIYT